MAFVVLAAWICLAVFYDQTTSVRALKTATPPTCEVETSLGEAIGRCCQVEGGGTVLLPSGLRVVDESPIDVCSDLTIVIDGYLKFSNDESLFPLLPPLPSYGIGRDVPSNYTFHPLIRGEGVSNVALRGMGTIDGSGLKWWVKHFAGNSVVSRPPLMEFLYSDGVSIEDLTIMNSPFWTIHPYASSNIRINNITVENPPVAPNTDGVDVDSCTNVTITNR
jgi:polygalacturonase